MGDKLSYAISEMITGDAIYQVTNNNANKI